MIPQIDTAGILTCKVDSDNGDVDLFLGVNYEPSRFQNDCGSETYTSREACSVVVSGATEVYALLFGYEEASDVTIECEVDDEVRTFDVGVDETSSSFDLPAGSFRLYVLEAPEATARVSCRTDCEDGGVDLYMRPGQIPVPTLGPEGYGCNGFGSFAEEYCEVYESGDIYILLKSGVDHDVTNGTLSCEVTLSGDALTGSVADDLELGESVQIDLVLDEIRLFSVNIPAGTTRAWCNVDSDGGDIELFMREGAIPEPGPTEEGGMWDCASHREDTTEDGCSVSWPRGSLSEDAQVYAMVKAWDATADVRVRCDADVPLTSIGADPLELFDTQSRDFYKGEQVVVVVQVEQGINKAYCSSWATTGDIDVYMNLDSIPESNDSWSSRGIETGGVEEASVSAQIGFPVTMSVFVMFEAKTDVVGGRYLCGTEKWTTVSRSRLGKPQGNPDDLP